jgi:hypothetical protein
MRYAGAPASIESRALRRPLASGERMLARFAARRSTRTRFARLATPIISTAS